MNTKLLPLLLVAAIVAAPATAAQGTGMSITGGMGAGVIPADTTTTIPFSVTVGCGEFLTGASQSIDITLETDLPDYFNAGSDAVSFAPGADCITSQEVTQTIDLEIAPTSDAWAYVPESFTVTATNSDGSLSADVAHEALQIAYMPGHTMATSIDFPYEFTDADNGTVAFDIDLEIMANGNTMVMFERAGANGTINNLFHQVFDLVGGEERQRSLTVSWSPPAGAWEEDVISFYTYSHCLDGPSADCGPTNEQNVTWVIKNMATTSSSADPEDEESPGLPMLGLTLALVAVAILRRRA